MKSERFHSEDPALPAQPLCASPVSGRGSDADLFLRSVFQEIRNMHNEQLMGIRREEEMEMSDDDMEEVPDSKDSEDSGLHMHTRPQFFQHDSPYIH